MTKNIIYVSETFETQQYVTKNPHFKGTLTIILKTEGDSPERQIKLKKELLDLINENCERLQP